MAIERLTFLEPPLISSQEEGMEGLQNLFIEGLMTNRNRGPILYEMLPEGEYNLLPDYLSRRGATDMSMVVLGNGDSAVRVIARGEESVFGNIVPGDVEVVSGGKTIQMPQDTQMLPVAVENQEGTGIVLTAIVIWRPGTNPQKLLSKLANS